MEHYQVLLLQTVIAAFEQDPEFAALVDQADAHILLHVNGPAPTLTKQEEMEAYHKSLDALVSSAPKTQPDPVHVGPEVPERLRQLAEMPTGPTCKGCATPNPIKDESGNCEICGYPGYH